MTDPNQQNVERFFEGIAPWSEAYSHPGLSYFAMRSDGQLHILQGRLFLYTAPSKTAQRHIQTQTIAAGYIPLADLGIDYRTFVDRIMAAEPITSPIGDFVFPVDQSHGPSTHLIPFHQEGLSTGNRLSVLLISGVQRHSLIKQMDIDWELKAAPEPFESLNELLNEFSLGSYRGDFANIEVVAFSVVAVDLGSKVAGEDAKPAIFLSKAADQNKSSLGYRVLLHGQVLDRQSICGEQMEWEDAGHFIRGVGSVKIPSGAALQCFASYSGVAQHQGWIADLSLAQNPRRASFEEFDERLTVLHDFLFEEQKSRKDARDFEVGVAWLLWMLGFSAVHSGATSRTSDAADILASTPKGHIAIVECTTGHLKAGTKLSKLVERAQTLRKRLDASGNHHIRLLPVIVTALSKEEVKADLDQAQKLGIVVVGSESLRDAISRTIVVQDADQLFSQAEESLRPSQEQLNLYPVGA